MSAPGNSVILLVLLSVFVGCIGYALGRMHERRMGGEEREEAYRDGYDHAARSVFSLAARVAGPRRRGAVRASVVVGEGAPRTGDSVPEPEATVVPEPAPPAPAPVVSAVADPPPLVPVRRRAPDSSGTPRPSSVGFPAPAPHPGLPEPAADGGVHYSSLPDPHWPAEPDPAVAPLPEPGPASVPAPRARHSAEPESAGRHTVPDELVRAATYKLAADRVARAKVRAPEEPSDPPVPRPRGQ
ncbi:hypothetical protein [Actinoplanes sp. L3-i22]|uniref:hypothetical protein n=1 Tax=Actinoplanes sp. L3-i22 TaxID=2836373 RepID=UPI001C747AAD|nr:hypothetical protein [Actinoplanes sp. L3-i22]BCY14082.1 hypothetical protein L3i22_091700 [Actinoplanes sp. L3-i22]